jgi:hypothetical protein
MPRRLARLSLATISTLILVSASALAMDHHALNGTWRLIPTRSEFNGEPMIQSGTVTIGYRDRNIYISHDYVFDGKNVTVSYQTSMDGRVNSSIRDGQAYKTKAKWEGDELKVTSTQATLTTVEHYRLNPDGTLAVTVDRPEHPTVTLFFERE